MFYLLVAFCLIVSIHGRELGAICGPNEEYVDKKISCPPETCDSINSFYDCRDAPSPKPGCACKQGFYRITDSSLCISICQCPVIGTGYPGCKQKCNGTNEHYVEEKPSCPPEACSTINRFYDCSEAEPDKPGCACMPGFLRVTLTSPCIPQCECDEIKGSSLCKLN